MFIKFQKLKLINIKYSLLLYLVFLVRNFQKKEIITESKLINKIIYILMLLNQLDHIMF